MLSILFNVAFTLLHKYGISFLDDISNSTQLCIFFLAYFAKHELDDYSIVYPSLVTESGQFLSHLVHNDHVRRLRRSLDDAIESNSSSEAQPLFYSLKINSSSDEVHLKLTSSKNVVSPGFIVEKESGSIEPHSSSSCLYQGHVTGQVNSIVAISNCHGLVSRTFLIFWILYHFQPPWFFVYIVVY